MLDFQRRLAIALFAGALGVLSLSGAQAHIGEEIPQVSQPIDVHGDGGVAGGVVFHP